MAAKALRRRFLGNSAVACYYARNSSGEEVEQTLKLLKQLPTIKTVWLDGRFDNALLERLQQALPKATIEQVEST